MLVEPGSPGSVAYVGVEIEGQTDDLHRALVMQAAWLSSKGLAADLALEARYVAATPDPRLVLLARVDGVDEPASVAAAGAAAEYLAATPGVSSRRLADAAEIAAVLRPFRPHAAGMVEIRKQVQIERPRRPDAGVRYYAAVIPFATTPSPRALLRDSLAGVGIPLVLGVGIRPAPTPPGFGRFLAENAAEYARLAQPATWRPAGSVHQMLRHLAPEPFAAAAEAHYRHAVGRYHGWLARLRIHLCSPAPITDAVAHLAGGVFGSYAISRPPTPDAASGFVQALDTLGHSSWPGDAEALGEPFRVLSLAADATEAAAALGLSMWNLGEKDRDDRERVLDVLVAVGRAMERAAPTYAGCDEETLRDHLITALNGAFAGSVYAEARNGQGRTDILIRIADRTVLIVECKIWNGPKRLHDAIDQLLGYVTRRDAAAALVVFLRGGPTDVVSRADLAIRAHPAFVRAGRSGTDTRGDFVLRRNDRSEIPVTFLPVG